MNRIQGLTVALGVALMAAGCDDEFLTTLPPDQVSGAVFWTQQKDAELAVIALYNQNQAEERTVRLEASADNGEKLQQGARLAGASEFAGYLGELERTAKIKRSDQAFE